MSGSTYYNEHDPYAAAWIRNLIAAGRISPGDVDERDIRDVRPEDLRGYTRCHFFAGIGVWDYALGLAGWPSDRPVWTGSCPCQPFSAAGHGGGFADERHLWPAWHHLIRECRPGIVLGEQVADTGGLTWLDLVQADLEGSRYACAPVDFCAAGAGAPIRRQRLWFVAQALECSGGFGWERRQATASRYDDVREAPVRAQDQHGPRVAGTHWDQAEWVVDRDGCARPIEPGTFPLAHGAPARVGRLRAYGNAIVPQVAAEFISAAAACISH